MQENVIALPKTLLDNSIMNYYYENIIIMFFLSIFLFSMSFCFIQTIVYLFHQTQLLHYNKQNLLTIDLQTMLIENENVTSLKTNWLVLEDTSHHLFTIIAHLGW